MSNSPDIPGALSVLQEARLHLARALLASRRGDCVAAESYLVSGTKALHTLERELGMSGRSIKCP